jgi:NAD(P)H-flavin reductase
MIYADIKVTTPERQKRTRFTAMVEEKTQLSDQILRLRLKPARDFAYKSGQYLTLINIDGYYADYPVASVHGADNLMEFHINTESEQELDRYISEQLEENDALEVQTAFAHHHYRSEERDKDLLLIARDEAIAGAFGLLREALHNEHSGTIHLIHLCEQLNTPYLAQALTELGTEQPAISCETLPANDSQALTARLESIKDSNNHCCFLWSNNTSDKLDIQEVANSLLNPRQLTVIKP